MGSRHATWREALRDVPNNGFLRETRGWQFALTFASMKPGGLGSLKLSMCIGNCRMSRLGSIFIANGGVSICCWDTDLVKSNNSGPQLLNLW